MAAKSRDVHRASARAHRLADLIMVLQRRFIARLSQRLARGQLSFAQYALLGHVSATDPLSMSEVARRMGHSTAAATGLVDRLEAFGYAQRVRAGADRRKVVVRITPKGQQLVGKIREDIVTSLDEFLGELTETQQKTWLQIYEKLHDFCDSCPTEATARSHR